MKKSTKQILQLMNVLSWIIFIGLCIKTGAIIYSFFVSLFINPIAASKLYLELNLSELKIFSETHYALMVLSVIALWGLKAYMFYLVIKIFLKINFTQPFSKKVGSLIAKISRVAFTIGVIAVFASAYSEWLLKQGVGLRKLPEFINGGSEYLFFSGIIFIIALVFKAGIEIQSELELTV